MPSARYCPRCLTTFANEPERCPNLGCGAPEPPAGWPALLDVGDVLDRTYKILARLAGGAAGMTYHARELDGDDELTGPDLAIKVLYHQRDGGPFLRRLATEAQILQELAHPHIVECRGFVHRAGRTPYLVTRYEPGGTLHGHVSRVGPLHPAVAAAILLQILDALEVAHRADVIHRDLKPGNILLRAEAPAHRVPTVLLADFGVARVSGSLAGMTRIGTFVGTPEYAAPEQFLGAEPTGATDLFAAGEVLWFCLTGEAPFRFSHRHDPARCYEELVALLPPPLPPDLPDTPAGRAIEQVLGGLLLPDPDHRWSTDRAREALRHVIAQARGEQVRGGASKPDESEPPSSRFDDPHGTFLWDEQDVVSPNLGSGGTLFADADVEPPQPPPTAAPPPRRRARALNPEAAPAPEPPKSSMEGLFDFSPDPVKPVVAPVPAQSTRSADASASRERVRPAPRPATPTRAAAPRGADTDPASLPDPFDPDGDLPQPPDPTSQLDAPPDFVDDDATSDESDPFEAFFDEAPDPQAALAVLGANDTPEALAALRDLDERRLSEALRQARTHDDPLVRRGAARATGSLRRTDQTSLLRALLRDPVIDVRLAATTALGQVAQGSALPQLARMLEDHEPAVRAAAARAVAEAYARDGDVRRGRQHLARLGTDRHPDVRDAFADALSALDRFGT